MADARNDVEGEYGGILGEQRLEQVTRGAEREIKAREGAIKERTPLLYFQPSEPIGEQIPPVRGLEDINVNEIQPQAFRAAIPYRFSSYLDYKEDAMRRLKNPKSFLEYQQFQFGNVIQPKTRVRDIDPDFLADLRRVEGPDGEDFYNLAIDNMNPDQLREAQRNPFYSAYEQKPSYSRGLPGTEQYDQEVEAFRDEIERGVADLTPLQRDILGDQARPLQETVGTTRELTIDKYRRAYPKNKELIKNRIVFRSEEERDRAESKILEFNARSVGLSPGKGRPSKSVIEQRNKLQAEKQAYIDTLTKGNFVTGEPDVYRAKTEQQQNLRAGLEKSLSRDEERRGRNVAERGDEGTGERRMARGRAPERDVQARQQMYMKLAEARELAMVREAEERKPKSITLSSRENVLGEKPLVVPLSNTSEDRFLYRASRQPTEGYYDPDEEEFDDEDMPPGSYPNPINVGIGGTKRPVQNKLFGNDSVFAAGTPEAAQNFIYENEKRIKGTWDIFKINVKGMDVVSFPEIGKEMASKITERYRNAPKLKNMPDRLQDAYKKYSDHYANTVAGKTGNLEHVIRGPINQNRISLHSSQSYSKPPTNNPNYKMVRENVNKATELQQEAINIEQDELQKQTYGG